MKNDKSLPFELTFKGNKIEAFAFGERCFETSNNFSNFDKVVITIDALTKGEVNHYQKEGKLSKTFMPIYLMNGDKVETTITRVGEEFTDKYNVLITSTSEIKSIKLECVVETKTVTTVDMPVKILHDENSIQKVMKVCHYCLKEDCKCGAERWVYIEIPFLERI